MSGVVKILILFCCVFLVHESVQAKPFLTGTFQNLASSLIAASSTSSDNVEDLRRQKPDKIRELSKYRQDEDKEELLEDDVTNGENEAVPNLFQKKIGAVLRKLQLIAEFGRRFAPKNGGEPKDPDFDFDFDEEFDGNGTETTTNTSTVRIGEDPGAQKLTSEGTKFFSPGEVGVYLMELVGSIVGLIYGAAIQIVGSSGGARVNQ